YGAMDVSFGAVHGLFSHRSAHYCDDFCEFLKQHTDILEPVAPSEPEMAPGYRASGEKPPHIFIFVIDSLRADYLSPYNPTFDFTPNLQEFGADSAVMRQAFTRYGGTSMAVPAIWAGSLLLHKHYTLPF